MRSAWRYLALLVVLAVASGAVYWLRSEESDWWAYVEDSTRGRWPKFRLTWPEETIVCGVVGALIAAPATAAVFLAQSLWSRLTNRCSRPRPQQSHPGLEVPEGRGC